MIEVTFTRAQEMAMQYDAIDGLKFVRGTKTTVTYCATREKWEEELGFAGAWSGMGSQWERGYGRSAGSAEGRIAKALAKASQK